MSSSFHANVKSEIETRGHGRPDRRRYFVDAVACWHKIENHLASAGKWRIERECERDIHRQATRSWLWLVREDGLRINVMQDSNYDREPVLGFRLGTYKLASGELVDMRHVFSSLDMAPPAARWNVLKHSPEQLAKRLQSKFLNPATKALPTILDRIGEDRERITRRDQLLRVLGNLDGVTVRDDAHREAFIQTPAFSARVSYDGNSIHVDSFYLEGRDLVARFAKLCTAAKKVEDKVTERV